MSAAGPAGSPDRHQRNYWVHGIHYRPAEHPVSLAYAVPKSAMVARAAGLMPGDTVLDVGTGNGTLFAAFARSQRCAGVDTSEHLLARHCARDRVALADAGALPFRDQSFDVVVESCLLHHVSDPGAVAAEMARVARRALAFVEPNMWNPLSLAFHALVRAERKALGFSRRRLCGLLPVGFDLTCAVSVGLVYPNRTPELLLPALRVFDRPWPLGNAHVIVAIRRPTAPGRASSPATRRERARTP
jgi:SAM-dependent methyltransferase